MADGHLPQEESHLGKWLVDTLKGLGEIELPSRAGDRPDPFADWTEEDFALLDVPAVGSATTNRIACVTDLDPFYPIVDGAAWVARLVGVGARLVQLRIKNADERAFARETRVALAICREAGATLVVNDAWRIAIDEGAEWVHLGQDDLASADLAAIRRAGVRLASRPPTRPNSNAASLSIPITWRSARSFPRSRKTRPSRRWGSEA